MVQENQNSWKDRLWGWASENLMRYGGLPASGAAPMASESEGVPRSLGEYAVRWAYRENKQLYRKLHAWGLAAEPYRTVYNPVPTVVAFYQTHALDGEIAVLPLERATADDGSRALDEALLAAIGRVQERSNWMACRRDLVEGAAVFGDVYIKAAERVDDAGMVDGVYLQVLPVTSIRRCEVDERGYVQALRIDTPRMESVFGGQTREHVLVEEWDGEGVRFYEVEGRRTVDEDELPPPVGAQTFTELGYDFIPVVWSRCATYWWDVVDQIEERNRLAWLMGRLNKPLMIVSANARDDLGRPMPPVGAPKERPSYEEVGGGSAAMLRLPGAATAAWSGSPVDFATMRQEIADLQAHIEGALPEYFVAARLQAVQVAAETLQMLLAQAGHRVGEMRDVLEAVLVRAQMMALTLGQAAELKGFAVADIGKYENGDFGHTFAERPVFATPTTVMAAEAGQHIANGVALGGAYRLAGYSEAEAKVATQMDATPGVEQ